MVLVNPVGDDAVRAHRPLRHLAQRLAQAGFAVLRFDLQGTGDSSGDEREERPDRVAGWIADVRLAIAEMRARSGPSISLVGLRLGATLATVAAAAEGGVDDLVLWGPHARGSAHVKESTRLYKMHRMLEPKGFSGGPRSRSEGEEAFGFLLTRATIAELETLDVRALAVAPARRALIVGDGTGEPAEIEIQERLTSLGTVVERRVLPGSRQFLVEILHKSRLPDEVLDGMVAWLGDAPRGAPSPTVAAPRERPVVTAPSPTASGIVEEPFIFGRRHPLFGILHRPAQPRLDAPPIVLASAGTVHRIGPHRFYVGLARRWAALGLHVLRVDLSGIGDSPAGDDGIENVTSPRHGFDELGEAMDALTEAIPPSGDRPRFIIAGLCSGGDFAFQMGMRDPRVVGSLIMNPRTFCVNDLAAVETGNPPSVLAAAEKVAGQGGEPVPASLRRMVERGVDTLLVVSEDDPGVHFVDVHWGDAMRALGDLPGFRREDVPGTDHNFTSLWAQERVSDLCTEHLVRRYLT